MTVPTLDELRSLAVAVADKAIQLVDEVDALSDAVRWSEQPVSAASSHGLDLELRQAWVTLEQLRLAVRAQQLTRQLQLAC